MATKKFQTLNAYYNYVNKQLESCMKEVGRQLRDEMKDYLFQKWYVDRTVLEYERTFNLLDSITFKLIKNSNNSYSVKIYYDTDLIKPEYNEYSFWNQHMSLSGEDVSKSIPYYIEYGNKSPIYSYNGIHIVEYMQKYVEENGIVKLSVLLYQRGIKIF